MEKVIILKGASGRGKTPTLHYLIGYFISRHKATLIFNEGYDPKLMRDCFVILEIPEFGKVGVITFGDRGCEESVRNSFQKSVTDKCVAVIGASHMQYYKSYETVYKILWDMSDQCGAKTVETSTIIKYDNWGTAIDEQRLNAICAENIANILFNI